MYWIEPLPGGNKAAQARQGKSTRAKGTDDLQWVWLVFCSCWQQAWWQCSGSTLGWSCPPACHSQPCHGCAKYILGGYLVAREAGSRVPLQIESLQTFSWLRKLSRGAKGLLHIHRNFLVFKIQGSLNFLTSICIYYSTKHIYGKKNPAPHFIIQGILVYTVLGLYSFLPTTAGFTTPLVVESGSMFFACDHVSGHPL